MKLLVGLGPYGGGLHTDQEYMLTEALEERIILGLELIREILRFKPTTLDKHS
jgi:glutamate carboxypeptidase